MPCSPSLAAYVVEHGTTTYDDSGDVLRLPSERAGESVEAPQVLLDALRLIADETGERVSAITVGQTARRYVPDGPLPAGMAAYEWQMRRFQGTLTPDATPDLPGVRIIEPEPCYELHCAGNPIIVESALRAAGFEAFSAAPFRVSVRLPTGR